MDFEEPSNNDWVAVNQFTIVENGKNRRPDVPGDGQRPPARFAGAEEPRR